MAADMPGSNIPAVKGRLTDDLPGVLGITFDYSYDGKSAQAERDYGYFGSKAEGPCAPAAMAGGARFTRSEELAFHLGLEVRRPGERSTRTAEADVVRIGARLEAHLAGNWLLGGDTPGLLKVVITDFDLESSTDDDGASATLTYSLQLSSHVR